MTAYTHTIRISDTVFQQIERLAQAKQQSVDALADEALRRTLPPALDHIPERFHADFHQLSTMSDATLWRISRIDLDEAKATRYEQLLVDGSTQSLDEQAQSDLKSLREEADLLMYRRAFALLLLRQRGHDVAESPDRS